MPVTPRCRRRLGRRGRARSTGPARPHLSQPPAHGTPFYRLVSRRIRARARARSSRQPPCAAAGKFAGNRRMWGIGAGGRCDRRGRRGARRGDVRWRRLRVDGNRPHLDNGEFRTDHLGCPLDTGTHQRSARSRERRRRRAARTPAFRQRRQWADEQTRHDRHAYRIRAARRFSHAAKLHWGVGPRIPGHLRRVGLHGVGHSGRFRGSDSQARAGCRSFPRCQRRQRFLRPAGCRLERLQEHTHQVRIRRHLDRGRTSGCPRRPQAS